MQNLFIKTLVYEKKLFWKRKITVFAGISYFSPRRRPWPFRVERAKPRKEFLCIIVTYSQQGHRKLCVFPTYMRLLSTFHRRRDRVARIYAQRRVQSKIQFFEQSILILIWLMPLFIFIYNERNIHYIIEFFITLFSYVFFPNIYYTFFLK